MDARNAPNNSNKYREKDTKREKPEKVIKGKVAIKKKSWTSKFINDDIGSIGSYIVDDLLIPTIKKTIVNVINGSTEKIFGVKSTNYSGGATTTRVHYNKPAEVDYRRSKSVFESNRIIFEARADAEKVKDTLEAMIEKYGTASVADLYDIMGQDCEFTGNYYGWTRSDMRNFSINYTGEGYRLNLPQPVVIK